MPHLGKFIAFWQKPLGNPIKEVGTCLLVMWVCGMGEAKGLGEMSSYIHFLYDLFCFANKFFLGLRGSQ